MLNKQNKQTKHSRQLFTFCGLPKIAYYSESNRPILDVKAKKS